MSVAKLLSVAGLAIALTYPALGASTEKLTTLHAFKGKPDGAVPMTNLLIYYNRLFGTTQDGGASGAGTIFYVDIKTGAEKVVYSFLGGTDGASPLAGLVLHSNMLYGTTFSGGASSLGTVFKFDPATGAETVLYSFGGQPDGASPEAGLVYHHGYLYGTTFGGGTAGNGTLFRVNVTTGVETVLHSFTGGVAGDGGTSDGGLPLAAPIYGDDLLLGTTEYGGSSGHGAVYGYNLKTRKEFVIYSFGGSSDGGHPCGSLVYQGQNLWGTTSSGGDGLNGTLFRIIIPAHEAVTVYSFTGQPDGSTPYDGLLYENGSFYGTTIGGGTQNRGTIFEFNINTGVETTLYSFAGTTDGGYPSASLTYMKKGTLYGTTPYSGASENGTIFKLVK